MRPLKRGGGEILAGCWSDAQIAGLLTALRMKGETVDELVGFATAMRRHAAPIFSGNRSVAIEPLVDTCGTGGDSSGSFNVSTAAAFVVAGAGVRVAKHGNRAISSRCGSADVLEHIGVRIDLPPERVARSIEEVGIGFLFAPALHAATRHAMPARRELRMRTVFNLLGPLTNPAGASAQVVGVYAASLTEVIARALGELGVRRAFVVHGADGLDEISLAGETYIAELRDAAVRSYTATPEDFGLRRAPLEAVRGGDAERNAQSSTRSWRSRSTATTTASRNRPNSAAALVAAGCATDFLDGVRRAMRSIDSGAARGASALVAFHQAEPRRTASLMTRTGCFASGLGDWRIALSAPGDVRRCPERIEVRAGFREPAALRGLEAEIRAVACGKPSGMSALAPQSLLAPVAGLARWYRPRMTPGRTAEELDRNQIPGKPGPNRKSQSVAAWVRKLLLGTRAAEPGTSRSDRVELHALDPQPAVPQAHNRAVGGLGGNLEGPWQ